MSLVNVDNLKNILSNTKDRLINKINIMKPGTFYSIVDKYTRKSNLPYNFYQGSASAVGTNIYLLGGYYIDGYDKYNHKYDTTTDTYSRMANIPFSFYRGSSVSIGTDIYLLGSNQSYTSNYKYDTTTGTYTKNTVIPYAFYDGSAVAIGTDIYLLGRGNNSANNYKYDTTTNTYTKNKDIPYKFYYGSAVAIGTNIYLFGSGYYENSSYVYGQYAYKYDITTDTYTHNRDIPYPFYNGAAVVANDNIYLLGGNANYNTNNYKYSTTNDSYTKNSNIPYGFSSSSAVLVNKDIYILGSVYAPNSYGQNNYIYSNYNITSMIKPTNHSIYTESKSYTDTASCIVEIGEDNYTEYNGNNIIKNTFSINSNGTTKMYIKSGAILNGNSVTVDTEGWNTINLLDYM